jgi:dihydrolipoamide dehydrogenase
VSGGKVTVPDLGDFDEVEVIEVLVQPGDTVEEEQGLITLETEKAAMDVPAPQAGRIEQVLVKVGDKVSAGSEIAVMAAGCDGEGEGEGDKGEAKQAKSDDKADRDEPGPGQVRRRGQGRRSFIRRCRCPCADAGQRRQAKPAPTTLPANAEKADHTAQLVVLGAGPGGYTAAFRAADLGMDVILVERWPVLGGVCLNVGCIPSKALLACCARGRGGRVVHRPRPEVRQAEAGPAQAARLAAGRGQALVGGLSQLARQRKVRVVTGEGRFINANQIAVEGEDGRSVVQFEQCIIAAGSESVWLPGWPDDERIMDSTGALELKDVPKRLLVVGGGIIGLEMGTVYEALGSKVSVVELTGTLMPGADRDLVRPLEKRLKARFESILTQHKVTGAEATDKGIRVSFEGDNAPQAPGLRPRADVRRPPAQRQGDRRRHRRA